MSLSELAQLLEKENQCQLLSFQWNKVNIKQWSVHEGLLCNAKSYNHFSRIGTLVH